MAQGEILQKVLVCRKKGRRDSALSILFPKGGERRAEGAWAGGIPRKLVKSSQETKVHLSPELSPKKALGVHGDRETEDQLGWWWWVSLVGKVSLLSYVL